MEEKALREDDLIRVLHDSIIGGDSEFESPFGRRRIVYSDYTASGKGLSFLEEYVCSEVLPLYGNTHTTSSCCGVQTTAFREEARNGILQAVNGSREVDQVIFTGAGCTAAVNTLCRIIFESTLSIKKQKRASKIVVFLGPFEHHSNILPWRESGVKVVTIKEDKVGQDGVDLNYLKNQLKKHKKFPIKIGSFSAASNVTGIVANVLEITRILHEHGALSFWDYAAGAPYMKIDMNPPSKSPESSDAALYAKDAVFISPHKLIGGPGASGILILKKSVACGETFGKSSVASPVPSVPGGGTVVFVTRKDHKYHESLQEREEGGTPNIIGNIRAGLVFKIQMAVGAERIHQLEAKLSRTVLSRLRRHPNIEIYGSSNVKDENRLPIVTLNIRHSTSSGIKFLHYNIVCCLLNDLFGVQVRGGCMCAGPYGMDMLAMSDDNANSLMSFVESGNELIKPGYVRLSFTYFMTPEEVEYILQAVEFVASNGWKLLPLYEFSIRTAAWRFRNQVPSTKSLGIEQLFGYINRTSRKDQVKRHDHSEFFQEYLNQAQSLVESLDFQSMNLQDFKDNFDGDEMKSVHEKSKEFRWYLLPSEALLEIKTGSKSSIGTQMSDHGEFVWSKENHVSVSENFPATSNNLNAKMPKFLRLPTIFRRRQSE